MANQSRYKRLDTVMSAVAANGWGTEFSVGDYRHVMVVISTASNAAGTIKVAGSFLEGPDVDFTSAAAVGNEWDFLYLYNLNSNTGVAGDTGIVYAGTDAVEQLLVNVDGIETLNVQLSSRTAGSFTVKLFAVTNQ